MPGVIAPRSYRGAATLTGNACAVRLERRRSVINSALISWNGLRGNTDGVRRQCLASLRSHHTTTRFLYVDIISDRSYPWSRRMAVALTNADLLFSAEARPLSIARALYAGIKDLPIISPHGHTAPRW